MIRSWLQSIFNLKKKDQAPEWRTDRSILDCISSQVGPDDKLETPGFDLPDEDGDSNALRFAPGLIDVMFGKKDDSHDAKNRIQELSRSLKQIAVAGDKTSEVAFYNLITQDSGVIGIIDEFLQAIVDERLPIEPYLFTFAKDLATRTNHRNCVKFGIAILGLCQNKTVLDDLLTLGLHDEFTIYAAIAIAYLSDRPVLDLWKLAKRVDGWGRIQIVDRLAHMEIPDEIQDWLIRDGYKNNIMYEELAFTCATRGRLHERLESESIDQELFQAAGEIILALIAGGPAQDISEYAHASAVINDYIRHAKQHTHRIADFLALCRIKDFVTELENDVGKHQDNGWTQELIANCLVEIPAILDGRDWRQPTLEGLESKDFRTYYDAKHAASRLGIDVWDTVWRRLTENPIDSSAWYDVVHYASPDKAAQIIEFALNNLPLDECATGPKDSLGFGPDSAKFRCLDYAISFLEDHVQAGERIVVTGLKSPVTRNRNMAIKVLAKWGQANWSEEIEREIHHLKTIEPNKNTRESIDRLLGH